MYDDMVVIVSYGFVFRMIQILLRPKTARSLIQSSSTADGTLIDLTTRWPYSTWTWLACSPTHT